MGRPKTWAESEALQRAMRVFWERGYQGASLRELVEATGVNRFSLYKEWGGKEGLYRATLQAYVDDLDARYGAILRREPLGVANIKAAFAELAADHFETGCYALNTIREKHVVPPAAFAIVEEFTAGIEAGLRANLEGGRAAGEIDEATDIEALAGLLAAIDIGLLTQRIMDPTADHSRELALLDRLLR